ncbi:jg20158 [Pararge aegeria aegeria]|uniref:Jg20158 protein n=1 Tax=Pararge aegeria aegeria TaxID=348720 RepID=A0A8S4QLY0_9NEOP|nr:jg20158 [Pararge aegeria aegeria]
MGASRNRVVRPIASVRAASVGRPNVVICKYQYSRIGELPEPGTVTEPVIYCVDVFISIGGEAPLSIQRYDGGGRALTGACVAPHSSASPPTRVRRPPRGRTPQCALTRGPDRAERLRFPMKLSRETSRRHTHDIFLKVKIKIKRYSIET